MMPPRSILLLMLLMILLAACAGPGAWGKFDGLLPDGTAATAQPGEGAVETVQPPTTTEVLEKESWLEEAAAPLIWLQNQPFQQGPASPADVLVENLPEGFEVLGPENIPGTMPGGGIAYRTTLEYQKARGKQVYAEDAVQVQIFSYDTVKTRSAHLAFLSQRAFQWEFYPLEGSEVARYNSESVDGRMWISGPYLIMISSGPDPFGIGPWLDTFAALYLDRYPTAAD